MTNTIQKAVYAALVLLPMTAFGAAAKPGVTKKTLIDTYLEGGWVMHLLLLFSIGMVWLIIDIWLRTNSKKMTPQEDVTIAQELFRAGDYVGAYQAMKASFSPFSEVMRAGLGSVGYGKQATEDALYSTVEKISSTLQTRINYLSVIGVCAPMIGLLGTVAGMITSFSALTAGKAEATDLAKGIGEALIATGGGLLLAIPSMFLYFFFRGLLTSNMADLHKTLSHTLDLFTGEAHSHPPIKH